MPLKSFRTSPLSSHLFPPSQPTPRRSPYAYANLLSQIAEPLRNVVAGEAGQELPLESDATEMVTEIACRAYWHASPTPAGHSALVGLPDLNETADPCLSIASTTCITV
ncbi:hypothetical protein FRC20_003074 [Serendipita sp. 405]|nr:hypothetical protein FRC20_003074 [Serendipita sp. 405]